ncbi:hypothetical protein AKJ16_DCAP06852 [Drosera capensis]
MRDTLNSVSLRGCDETIFVQLCNCAIVQCPSELQARLNHVAKTHYSSCFYEQGIFRVSEERLYRDGGILPEILFIPNPRKVRCRSLPIVSGMVPTKALHDKLNSSREETKVIRCSTLQLVEQHIKLNKVYPTRQVCRNLSSEGTVVSIKMRNRER